MKLSNSETQARIFLLLETVEKQSLRGALRNSCSEEILRKVPAMESFFSKV